MDRRNNPYAPGAGLQPPALAGRDELLENASIDMERALSLRPTRGLMMLGLRGVGKTVLPNCPTKWDHLIASLLPATKPSIIGALKPEIQQFIENPTAKDTEEELHIVARECLAHP